MLGLRLEENDSEELLWRGAGTVTFEATFWFWMLYQYNMHQGGQRKVHRCDKSPLCTDVR
ncbi:unnamed protein product [Meloidogyne enterolobii]|uniref:Uncharacterized protein n=1 Tax=Meloidogyne enterolobii TaxID=390850 RepID=A0ACB1A9Y0_MELEN